MNETDAAVRRRAIYGVTLAGSVVNVVLVLCKFAAGILGRSAAMIADAVHSLSDLATDVIVLVFVRISDKPEDKGHDYEELKEFVRKVRFDRMGAFAYSEEEGTYAAAEYEDSIPQEVKQARLDELMSIQQGISGELSAEKVGRQMKVIIDRLEGEYYIGRTEFDSPEVDPEVLIERGDRALHIGNFYHVEIVNSDDFDLFGRII